MAGYVASTPIPTPKVMKEIYVLVTMDVEVPRQAPGASGPEDWPSSEA